MPYYTVVYGDCLSTIARRHGLTWPVLWNHPNNADFRAKRKDPNIIYPGDVVFIPTPEPRVEPADTEKRHTFRVESIPIRLRVRILDAGEPVANEKYDLEIDGIVTQGTTDAKGMLETNVPSTADEALLTLTERAERRVLKLGGLDPLTEVTGVQGRLHNLGFLTGPIDGLWGPVTEGAVKRFQRARNITVDGIVGPQTRAAFVDAHGC